MKRPSRKNIFAYILGYILASLFAILLISIVMVAIVFVINTLFAMV